jgi:hypothetical protein
MQWSWCDLFHLELAGAENSCRCRECTQSKGNLRPPVPQTGALTGLRYAPPGHVACVRRQHS